MAIRKYKGSKRLQSSKKVSVNQPTPAPIIWLLDNLRFIGFLTILLLIYIFNTHYAEKQMIKAHNLQSQLQDMRWQYESLKANLNHKSQHSEIAHRVAPYGLKSNEKPLVKIVQKVED